MWDQIAGMQIMSPAAAAAEEVAGAWLLELLGLPRGVSFGFTTGAQMANFTGLAAARHATLSARDGTSSATACRARRACACSPGRAVARDRLPGAALPRPGRPACVVPADVEGRMLAAELARALEEGDGPGDRLRAGR